MSKNKQRLNKDHAHTGNRENIESALEQCRRHKRKKMNICMVRGGQPKDCCAALDISALSSIFEQISYQYWGILHAVWKKNLGKVINYLKHMSNFVVKALRFFSVLHCSVFWLFDREILQSETGWWLLSGQFFFANLDSWSEQHFSFSQCLFLSLRLYRYMLWLHVACAVSFLIQIWLYTS